MRLIDADELVYIVIGEDTDDNPLRFVPTEFIENAPTIDAEQVVRCKDCKYYIGDNSIPRGMYCELLNWRSFADEYCSLGERK